MGGGVGLLTAFTIARMIETMMNTASPVSILDA
jgi:hypothetical protein